MSTWTHVQGTGAFSTENSSTLSAVFDGAVAVGDLLLCGIRSPIANSIGVADNKSNDWSLAGSLTWDTSQKLYIYSAIATTGGSGLEVTLTGTSTQYAMSLDEFAAPGTLAFDTSVSNSTSGSSPITLAAGSLTPLQVDLVYVVAAVAAGANVVSWAGDSAVLGYATSGGGGSLGIAVGTGYVLDATTAVDPSLAATVSGSPFTWGALAIAFRAPSPTAMRRRWFPGLGQRGR